MGEILSVNKFGVSQSISKSVPQNILDILGNHADDILYTKDAMPGALSNLSNISIDVCKFKYAPEIDWALALNRAIQYFVANKLVYGRIMLPQGVLDIRSNIDEIPEEIYIEGKGAFLAASSPGTFINDLRPEELTETLFRFQTNRYITGHLLKNLTICGNYRESDCIYCYKCGWDFRLENVLVKRYNGAALRGSYLNDSNFNGFMIVECGSDGDAIDPVYALEFENGCNALHFTGLHMEHCRFFMHLKDTFFVDFGGSKWEQSTVKMGTNLTHPPIWLEKCREVTFGDGCGFIPIGVKSYLLANPNMDISQLPYFIGGTLTDATVLDREVVKFNGCVSTTGLGSGGAIGFPVDYSLLINLPKRVIIESCVFNWLSGILEPIKVGADGKPGTVAGNFFNIKDHPASINTDIENPVDLEGLAKGINTTNCQVYGNTVWQMSGGGTIKTNSSYAFTGVLNEYGNNNRSIGFSTKYKDTANNVFSEILKDYILPVGCKSEYRFDDEITSQAIKDYTYKKQHGQLGSTTGTDANDPAWDLTTGGLKFVAANSQYAKLPLSISVASEFTVYCLATLPSTPPAANSEIWSIGNSGSANPSIKVYMDTQGNLVSNWSNDSNVGGTNSNIYVPNVKSGYRLLKFWRVGSNIYLKDVCCEELNGYGNINGSTGVKPADPITVNQIGLGCLLKNTPVNFMDTTICFFVTYQRACTNVEDVKVYKYVKRMMLERGISI